MMTVGTQESNWLESLIEAHEPGGPLEQAFYNSPDIFEREMEQIFLRHWLFVDHVSRIPKPGDYFLYEIGGESIIFLRGEDQQIRAFFNVCRHRGSRVCLEEEGNRKRLVCPYHAWVYNLDGSLAQTRHLMPEDFRSSDYGLQPAQVRVLEGMIFVYLGEDRTEDFDRMVAEVQPFLKPHGWPEAKICKRQRYLIRANWKLVAENSMECYHCAPAHPEFAAVMSYVGALTSKRMAKERDELVRQWEEYCTEIGHKIGHVDDSSERWWTVHRLPIQEGYLTQAKGGQPVAPLMGSYKSYDGGITGLQIYPMSFMVASSDHAYLNRFTPVDANHTELEASWLVRADAEEGRDYDPDQVSWLWRVTGEADVRICEDNQKGVNSRRYKPGRYALVEKYVEQFIQLYLQQLQHGARYGVQRGT